MVNLGLHYNVGNVARKKCTCNNCLGKIPKDRIVYDTKDGFVLPYAIKEMLKDILQPNLVL